VLDVSEIDTGKDVILDAVRRFRAAAVADADLVREIRRVGSPAGVRIGLSSLELAWLGARRLCVGATPLASLLGDAHTLIAAVAALQRTTVAYLQQYARTLRDTAMTRFARGHRFVRVTAIGVRHRLVRSL
jgi:hypothetical protein